MYIRGNKRIELLKKKEEKEKLLKETLKDVMHKLKLNDQNKKSELMFSFLLLCTTSLDGFKDQKRAHTQTNR